MYTYEIIRDFFPYASVDCDGAKVVLRDICILCVNVVNVALLLIVFWCSLVL